MRASPSWWPLLDCATPDTFDVQLCNRAIVQLCDCAIVCCSSKSKDADAQPSPPSQTTQTTLCDQRLHSSHCFGRRLGCHMFQSILLQKVKESFCFLLATTNKKVWDWVNAILWVMNAFKFALFGIAQHCSLPVCPYGCQVRSGANTAKLLTPRLSSLMSSSAFLPTLSLSTTCTFTTLLREVIQHPCHKDVEHHAVEIANNVHLERVIIDDAVNNF